MSESEDDDTDREELGRLATFVNIGIALTGSLCVFLYGWLTLKWDDFERVLSNTSPDMALRLGLIAYFTAWVSGAPIDLALQKKVLAKDRNKGRLTLGGFCMFASLAASGVMVVAASFTRWFSVALLVFWAVHLAALWYMKIYLKPIIAETGRWYFDRGEFSNLEKLRVLDTYQFGHWTFWKYLPCSIVCGLLVVISFSNDTREFLAWIIHPILPLEQLDALLPAITFFLFVLLSEGSQWTTRLIAINSIRVISRLRKRYKFVHVVLLADVMRQPDLLTEWRPFPKLYALFNRGDSGSRN